MNYGINTNQQLAENGITLVELMITVFIISILLVLGVPSYQRYIGNQSVKYAASELFMDLQLARSEAIKRNASITFIARAQGWQNGWDIKLDTQVLRTNTGFNRVAIADSDCPAANCETLSSITFNRAGRLTTNTNFRFTISSTLDTSTNTARCISINLSGQISSSLKTGSSC